MEKPVYFISDLHLGASYITDKLAHERHIVSWLNSIKGNASTLYMVGDVMDYWYDYKYVVPRGNVRFLAKLAELVESGVEVIWFKGNHDIWLYDYMQSEIGVKVVDNILERSIAGKKFFITHGDGVGSHTRKFKLVRRVMRSRWAQTLYAAIHPSWSVPFAKGCSKSSRDNSLSKMENDGLATEQVMLDFSREYLKSNSDIDFFVYGHSHQVKNLPLTEKTRFIELGDWVSKFSYGVFDGETFVINYYPITEK